MSNLLKIAIFVSFGFLALLGWHFGTVLGLFGTAPETSAALFFRVALIVVATFCVSAGAAIYFAKRDGVLLEPDEREEGIELRSERNGAIAIYGGLLCLIWFLSTPMTHMQIANGILLVVAFTEVVKLLTVFYFYKRRF